MSRRIREKTQIASEIRWLYANYNKFDFIMSVKQQPEGYGTIGEKVSHIKRTNYQSIYNELIQKEKYTVCLSDMSIICMFYVFDKMGTVVSHNLMYLPTPIDENGQDDFETICAKYIRIDFDQTGYQEIDHTKVHLHIGLYKTEFRIPIAHYFTPKEFIYFIAKYIYHNKSEFIERLIAPRQKTMLLSDRELKAAKLLLGDYCDIT